MAEEAIKVDFLPPLAPDLPDLVDLEGEDEEALDIEAVEELLTGEELSNLVAIIDEDLGLDNLSKSPGDEGADPKVSDDNPCMATPAERTLILLVLLIPHCRTFLELLVHLVVAVEVTVLC